MKDGKYIVARIWPDYRGDIPSRAPVILGINPEKYETILVYLTKNSDKPNFFDQSGKKVFYITKEPRLGFFKPLVFLKMAKLFKTECVDILHCHMHKATVYGTIAGKLAKVPIILSHVHGLGRTRNFRRKLLNYFLLSHVNKLLAVGQAVKEDILKHNRSVKPENVINIGNSIDYEYYSKDGLDRLGFRKKFNIPQDAFVFATAGRLAATKGQIFLIEAFAKIRKQLPNSVLLFAGSGPLKDELETRACELDCKDSVYLPGRLDNMPEFYNSIDTFILPSIAEGLPRTLLEAMAAGVLCVASDVGGIPEILDNGRLGFLVNHGNPDDLADAMLKTYRLHPERKLEIIYAARMCVKNNFNHPVVIKTLEKLYDTLLKKFSRASKNKTCAIQ